VSLVCVSKCHPASALMESAVLSCPAVSLCTAKSSPLGVSSASSGLRIEIITAVNLKITVRWNVAPCGLVYFYCVLEESVTFIFQT
jgi:hypothetical protein